jgi:nucleoside 2-deoxyribosyltransferase
MCYVDNALDAYDKIRDREFKVATICGSMRFFDRMLKVAEVYTAAGSVVLMPFVAVATGDQEGDHKAMLDRMHRQKIDMADVVVVVTDRDSRYVGDSTKAEIAYAEANGKAVIWQLESPV